MYRMPRFNVGDLLRFKPSSKGFRPLEQDLVLVVETLAGGHDNFFYGYDCHSGQKTLFSSDQFLLVSKADDG